MANTTPSTPSSSQAGERMRFFRSPTQLVVVVTAALAIPIIIASAMIGAAGGSPRAADDMSSEAIEARIRPVAGFELKEIKAGGPARAGEVVFKEVCTACHTAGVSGAPKFGDKDAWAPRIARGMDALLQSALKGKGAMPAQGGGDYSDQEIANAMVYMANAGGASFEPPKLAGGEPSK
ncbi:MAG: c-type cytochrome [Lautropia sp.]|nr:c-type cytochrome [Lautropia sp.]